MPQKIRPFLWFNRDCREVVRYYKSIFKDCKVYDADSMSARFRVNGLELMALTGGPLYKFTEAVSFFIECKTQKEIDSYWAKLSRGGKQQRCGWLKDKFGVSWQVVPNVLGELIGDADQEKAHRAIQAMLTMKKLDIAKLKAAHAGKGRR